MTVLPVAEVIEKFTAMAEVGPQAVPVLFYRRGDELGFELLLGEPVDLLRGMLVGGDRFDQLVFCAELWVTRFDGRGEACGLDEALVAVELNRGDDFVGVHAGLFGRVDGVMKWRESPEGFVPRLDPELLGVLQRLVAV